VAEVITGTHYAYPWRDGKVELVWVAGYIPSHPHQLNLAVPPWVGGGLPASRCHPSKY